MAMLLVSLILCSCPDQYKMNNNGYPKTVTLLGTGDKKMVSGEIGLGFMEISDSKFTVKEDEDSLYYQKDWLTIRYKLRDKHFECIAEPNSTKDKRVICIKLEFGNEYGLVDVVQNGNLSASSAKGLVGAEAE